MPLAIFADSDSPNTNESTDTSLTENVMEFSNSNNVNVLSDYQKFLRRDVSVYVGAILDGSVKPSELSPQDFYNYLN